MQPHLRMLKMEDSFPETDKLPLIGKQLTVLDEQLTPNRKHMAGHHSWLPDLEL